MSLSFVSKKYQANYEVRVFMEINRIYSYIHVYEKFDVISADITINISVLVAKEN
jgi:hypothetical protein